MVKSRYKSVDLTQPHFRLTIYKGDHDGDTVNIAVTTPEARLQSIHLYVSDIPIDEAIEMFTQAVDMLTKMPVKSKKQRRLKGLGGAGRIEWKKTQKGLTGEDLT